MNFELNDDQQAYIASAKAFSDKELAPHAAHWDAESVFAKDALKAAGELGFMGTVSYTHLTLPTTGSV